MEAYFSANRPFRELLSAGNSIVLFPAFFSWWKLLLILGPSQFLKTTHIHASGHHVFRFFQRFFEVEAAFPNSGNVLFNILYPASANGFSVYCNQNFLVRAILLLVETIIGIRRKQFSNKELISASEQLIFRLVETIFFNEIVHFG